MAIQKITADVIATSAVTTDSLSDSSITAAKLHTTLDLTGKTVTVATASAGDNDTTVASTAFVSTAIANLADSAPSTLDTLNELAAALGDDANFSTTVTNSIATKLPLAGGTLTGNLNFGDSDKAVFGAGSDLQISHDGLHSKIQDVGTGDLKIQATNLLLEAQDGTNYIYAVDGTAVRLYHPDATNGIKLATTSTGIDVTGTATMDGLTLGGTATFNIGTENIGIDITSTDAGAYIALNDNNATGFYLGANSGIFYLLDTGNSPKLKINNNGDISFYDNTGVSQALYWDASAERVGLGTTSPLTDIHIVNSGAAQFLLQAGDSSTATMLFGDSADTNIGWIQYDNSDNNMNFRTNNTERMRIDSSGNVGIGTDSPQSTVGIVDIAGSATNYNTAPMITFRDSTGAADSRNWSIGNLAINYGDFHIGVGDSNSDYFDATSHSKFMINKDGNVGIGTTSPDTLLELRKDTASSGYGTYPTLSLRNDNASGYSAIHFQEGSTQRARVEVGNNSGTPYMGLYTTSGASGITIKDGNVGIGTSSPLALLDVAVLSSGSRRLLVNYADSIITLQGANSSSTNESLRVTGDNLRFATGSGTGTEKMRIFNNGRVKIGGSFNGVNAGLHVANADIRCTAAAIANDANSISMSQESVGGVITCRGPSTSTRGSLYLSVNQSNGGGGRTGFKIDNLGLIYAEHMGSGGATTDVNYNTSTGEIYQVTSSQRYKENISEYTDSILEKVNNLTVKNFDYKEGGYTNQVGLIAEEVEEQIPYLVNKKEIEGYDEPQPDSVKYSQLSVFLLKAIQEQQTIIDDLKSRLETLEG
jgi:hypothetical protein